ncbi:DUF3052 domain-containing protein [Piscinibacter sp.]|uniref:DUF3052 domain-containing protein n=1 Tax=Piscinibacter sp. TaxID=1903157 RepID=UPI0039E6118D
MNGYSGTPLATKLGYKAGTVAVAIGAPADYATLLAPLPPGVVFARTIGSNVDLVHVFLTERAELARRLTSLRGELAPDAAVWTSWPKKASKVPTSITEDVIREEALPLGYVDIKVCAVDAVWSGLKLAVRKELRARPHEPS